MKSSQFIQLKPKFSDPISYELCFADHEQSLEIGRPVQIIWDGLISCVACQRSIKKSYQGGYCYLCFRDLARCDICIVKPERCHYHLGTCREPEWGLQHCFTEHVVYLANTTGVKVGISRATNIPTRWMDQGATEACILLRCSNRRISGLIEVHLAEFIADKTKWRDLICGRNITELDLFELHEKWCDYLKGHLQNIPEAVDQVCWEPFKRWQISFPVSEFPKKAVSLKLVAGENDLGLLLGVKGQYLLFEHGGLNMRNLKGYNLLILQ